MSTIAVAVSGGVDSMVAAFLLKRTGRRIIALHFRTGFESASSADADSKAVPDAIQALGDRLEIPLSVIDLSGEFRETVVDYFAGSYLAGLTPNPCLVCNPGIKFGALLRHARLLGADSLATGHYARLTPDAGGVRLFRGVDPAKDQSYFLSRLTPDQLAHARFPLGSMRKTEVRRIAAREALVPTVTSESQDICFIRNQTYSDFIARQGIALPGPGPIVDTEGREIGRHKGLHLYTVGQRRGIDCPAQAPYYVVGIDRENNRLVVGFRESLGQEAFEVGDVNWIRKPTDFPAAVSVQVRYRHRGAEASIEPAGTNRVRVRFRSPQKAVAPGQGAVFYIGDEVIGGGWILSGKGKETRSKKRDQRSKIKDQREAKG
ncbi:MAG: tRNA 2-thiouridine(34) synthase MnmA [Desulfobacterales bacterium]